MCYLVIYTLQIYMFIYIPLLYTDLISVDTTPGSYLYGPALQNTLQYNECYLSYFQSAH